MIKHLKPKILSGEDIDIIKQYLTIIVCEVNYITAILTNTIPEKADMEKSRRSILDSAKKINKIIDKEGR